MGKAMTMPIFAAALLAALASPALAQTASPTTAEAPAADLVPVAIDTNLGRIVVALDKTHAPISTANFLHYVDTHRYDGETIYRAMRVGDGGLIQGGVHQQRPEAIRTDQARADVQHGTP